jgi:hypothetical protein
VVAFLCNHCPFVKHVRPGVAEFAKAYQERGLAFVGIGEDLRRAADAVLAGREPDAEQAPSVGCGIKWKPGNEPDYFG